MTSMNTSNGSIQPATFSCTRPAPLAPWRRPVGGGGRHGLILPCLFFFCPPPPRSARGTGGAPGDRINMGLSAWEARGTGHRLRRVGLMCRRLCRARAIVQVLAGLRRSPGNAGDSAHKTRCHRDSYAQKCGQAAYEGVKTTTIFREVLARGGHDAVLLAVCRITGCADGHDWRCVDGKDAIARNPAPSTVRERTTICRDRPKTLRAHYQAGRRPAFEYAAKFTVRMRNWCARGAAMPTRGTVTAYRKPGD